MTALLLSAQSLQAFPCFDVADAQQCWMSYAESGVDPGFNSARAYLQEQLNDGASRGGLVALSLAQLGLMTGSGEDIEQYSSAAVLGCLRSAQLACELQARRFLAVQRFGDSTKAAGIWEAEKAFALSGLAGSAADQVKAASQLAYQRLTAMTNIPRALQVIDQVLPAADQVDPKSRLYLYHWRARAGRRLGHLDQTLFGLQRVADEARQWLPEAGADRSEIRALGEIAEVRALGLQLRAAQLQTQRQTHDEALAAIISDPGATPVRQITATLVRHEEGVSGVSAAALEDCARRAVTDAPRRIQLGCETALAERLAPSDLAGARRWLEKARQTYNKSPSFEATSRLVQAELHVLWADHIDAATVTRSLALLGQIEAGRSEQRRGDRAAELLSFLSTSHYWLADRIVDAVETGQLPQDYLLASIEVLESARASQAATERQAVNAGESLARWLNWRQTLLAQPGSATALSAEEFKRAEAMAEDHPPTTAAAPSADLRGVTQYLTRNEALLFFQWHHSAEFQRRVFLITAGGVKVHHFEHAAEISRAIALLNTAVPNGLSEAATRALGTLETHMAEPLQRLLPGPIEAVTLIPDGELYAVPFGATQRAGSALREASMFGSLKSFIGARSARPTTTPSTNSSTNSSTRPPTVAADPAFSAPVVFAAPSMPPRPLPGTTWEPNPQQLPGAMDEANSIARLLPESQVLVSHRATETAARQAMTGGDTWLHFAAHVRIQQQMPMASGLQLAADDSHDGWLTVKEISELQMPPKLVVLSACESGSGRRLTGEGLIGLSSALLDAGAVTVAANLWPVDDAYAQQFITRWYTRLAAGMPVARALNATRDEFSDAGYPPGAWAGWTLAGDSRLVTGARSETGIGSWLLMPGLPIFCLGFIITGLLLRTGKRSGQHPS